MYLDIMVTIIALFMVICGIWVIVKQQRTIDRLTDKLMAGDYRVYKSLDKIKEEDASPPPQEDDGRLSWHDN